MKPIIMGREQRSRRMSKTPSFWVVMFEDDGMRIIAGSFQTYEQALHVFKRKKRRNQSGIENIVSLRT